MEIIRSIDTIERASRGLIRGWNSPQSPTPDKPRLDTVFSVYRKEPTLNSAIKAIADEIIKNGFHIKTKNKQLKERIEKDLKEKYRFDRILRKLIYNLLIYGNVFVEIVYDKETPKEMHILETTEMEILSDEHGEVRGYIQKHDTKEVEFTND